MEVLQNTARKIWLTVLTEAGAIVTSGTHNALCILSNPGQANDGYYWNNAGTPAYQAGLPTWATEWVSAAYVDGGRWAVTVPAGALNVTHGATVDVFVRNTDGTQISETRTLEVRDSLDFAVYSDVSGLATAAALDVVDNFLDTEIAAILAAVDTEIATLVAATDTVEATLTTIAADVVLIKGYTDDLIGAGNGFSHTLKARNGTVAGDPAPGVTLTLWIESSGGVKLGAVTTDANGDATITLPAATYTVRPVSPSGGWTATSATTSCVISGAGGSTVIAGTSTAAPSPVAGYCAVTFHIGKDNANVSGARILVRHEPGYEAPVDSTPDTLPSVSTIEETTDASGNATVYVLKGVPFKVWCDEIGETGANIYRTGPSDSSAVFAVIHKAHRR